VPRSGEKPSWEWGLELVEKAEGLGRKAEVNVRENRIEINRGDIVEWYINDEKGLEQGFTIYKRESVGVIHESPGKLNIDMKLTGRLHPKFAEDGQAIDFYDGGNVSVLRYGDLKVTDATGAILPSRFEPVPGGIRISADDANAVYPVTIDPLATTPAWTAEGDQAGASFGYTVATAGDVNGDGYSDVIVGANQYDNGETGEGRAFLYLGSASGLSATASWTAEGNQTGAGFGWSVATAGDVNGDGYGDVIVGGCGYDNGQFNEGRAYLYLGSASGLSANAAWTAESDQFEAYFGRSVATAGDVNGDGYSDVIIGANFYDNGQADEGRAFLYLGSASGLSATASWTAEGDQDAASFGYTVATAGDVNGDGYSDVIVGAYLYDNGETDEGRVFVYLGSASGLSGAASWTAEGDQAGASFGWSVATAGDVNGDGYSDVIVGAYQYDNGETDEGRAYLYLGSASGLSATASWTAESDQAGAEFGWSVATAGDVNGDGYSDVIVGAYLFDNGETDEGRAFLYLGSASGLSATASWTPESDQPNAVFGRSVATAGDVNGDGYSDVIVGANQYSNGQPYEGRAFLYLGSASW